MSDEFKYPECDKAGLIRNYRLEYGMTVSAEECEKVLKALAEIIHKLEWKLDQIRRAVG